MSTRWILDRFRAASARKASRNGTAARRISRMAWLGVLALLAGSLLNLVVAPGVSAAAEAASSVAPAVGGPSMRFSFTASGFKGDLDDDDDDKSNDAEKVSFWINTPDGQTIRATDDDDAASYTRASRAGTVTWAWQAPADALPGAYTLVAHGITSGHDVVIPFAIDGSARGTLITAERTVTPSAGAAGSSFSFALYGFKGDVDDGEDDQTNNAEEVSFWINLPNGQVIPAVRAGVDADDDNASVVRASRAGKVELTWQAPANAPLGTYTLVAHGNESDREQVVAFEIQ
jgi:hypothetical protein